MVEIIPAIMPVSFDDLCEKLSRVKGLASVVQIDVMDGKFVPEKNWPLNEAGQGHFAKIIREEEGLPNWGDFDFEIDLMVSNPAKAIDSWIVAGAKRLIIHIESVRDFSALVSDIRAKFPKGSGLTNGDSLVPEFGVALNTTTPTDSIYPFLSEMDFVQFMGIEKIGFQGQPFDERVIDKIRELRTQSPDYTISVDGGVNLDTAPRLISVGANRLAVGSALFESENIKDTIKELQRLT